jgi:pSer/pThr/pTyr-binding forkhead associated (FHA) protein
MTTAKPYQKHLFIVEDTKGQKEYILDSPAYSLGRGERCDIRLPSLFASSHHATLIKLPQDDGSYSYQIIDGDGKGNYSTNGLIVNGQKLRSRILQHKDKIIFGSNVQATYLYIQRHETFSGPIQDPDFDVTLIDPGMLEETPEEKSSSMQQSTPGQL